VDSVTLTSAGAAATAVVAGSPYPIVPSNAVGARVGNYTITYVNGGLTVNTKPLTITADSRSKVYGATATFAGTEFTVAGLVNADSVTSVTLASPGAAATATVAGSPYAIVPSSAVGAGLANYAITYVNGVLTVTPATLTVTAKSASRPFGTPNPDVAGPLSIVGYVNGENASVLTALPTCATTATLLSPVGSYPVTCGGAVAANYEFVYVNGTLSVGAWHLTGFYQPVGVQNSDHTAPGEPLPTISDVWNSIKGGQTVPLKFELFVSQGGAERTSVTDVASFTLVRVGCSAGPEDPVEPFPTSGATQLRYDLVDGQFIQNWQSPKGANQCYRVTMTALDGSSISAFFKTK
jgi:hypothetical protein